MSHIRHRTIVSRAFTVSGVLLGLPSFLSFLWLSWAIIRMHLAKPAGTPDGAGGADSIVNLLVAGGRILGKTMSLFGDAVQALLWVLVVIAFLVLCFAAILLLVGRGLHRHQSWARVLGILLAFGLLLASMASVAFLQGAVPTVTAVLVAISSVYILWVLFRRFAADPIRGKVHTVKAPQKLTCLNGSLTAQ